jgi:hypothetical protein
VQHIVGLIAWINDDRLLRFFTAQEIAVDLQRAHHE